MSNHKIVCKAFSELDTTELFRLLQLRCAVFVVEQNCAYLDPDEKDPHSIHAWIQDGLELSACLRIVPPGISYLAYSSIGRIASAQKYRNQGHAKRLIGFAIKRTFDLFPDTDIKISAQSYLEKYYCYWGFRKAGSSYLEDGIPHIPMILSKETFYARKNDLTSSKS